MISTSIDRFARAVSAPVRIRETLAWCIVGVALMVGHLLYVNGPTLADDSYQYLSVAQNFGDGRLAYTSIIHFDTERTWGQVPAPMTTFPAGYPALIAVLHGAGLTPELAAVSISMAAVVLLLLAFHWAGTALAIGGLGTRFLFAWTLGNSEVMQYAGSVLTESLFTLLSVSAVLLFLAALTQRERAGRQIALFLAANVLIGFSYWVRYAGLFLFTATALYVAFLLLHRRDRTSLRAAASLTLSGGLIGLGMLRNYLLVGTWKGGNNTPVSHPLVEILRELVASIHHLFLGELVPARLGPIELILFGTAAVIVALAAWRFLRRASTPPLLDDAWQFPLVYIIVYCAAMMNLGVTSVISFGPRMFIPLLPVLLLIAALTIKRVQVQQPRYGSLLACALILASGAYVAINARSYVQPLPPLPHETVERLLAEKAESDITMRAWIAGHIGADETVVANQGQAAAYVLRRNTVSLVSLAFTGQGWDEQRIRSVMQTYRARYLILFADKDAREIIESPFLSGLVERPAPAWLRLKIRSPHVFVFRADV